MSTPEDLPANWENRNFARSENTWYLRHAEVLARWPVLPEEWALKIERRRRAEMVREGASAAGISITM